MSPRVGRRILDALMRLLPPGFREQYGDEMRWAQERRLEAASREGRPVGAWVRELGDLVRTCLREWAGAVGDLRHPSPATGGRGGGVRAYTLRSFPQDVRLALRGLRRNPGFAAVCIAMLAVGIGANTAIFSVVDAVLLRSLPYEGGNRLGIVWTRSASSDETLREWVSYPDYSELEREQRDFEAFGGFRSGPVTLLGDAGAPSAITAVYATHSLFSVVGVEPELGRVFNADEDRLGGERVVVLSHGLWASRFGASPGVLGSSVVIDGDPHTVIGVMPEGYAFPIRTDVWLPGRQNFAEDQRGMHRLRVRARLRPGTDFGTASLDVAAIGARLAEAYPENEDQSFWVESLQEATVSNSRQLLLTLMGSVGLVLLIVCANVANLLLTRATARSREVAVRRAMGAGRRRLLAQFLTEGLVLSAVGGALGVGIAYLALDLTLAAAPAGAIPRVSEITLDGRVLVVVVAAVLGTAVVFGLIPALRGSGGGVADDLRDGGTRSTASGGQGVRSGLVVLETALALMLVFGAGLLVRSFRAVESVDPGFQPDNLWAVPVVLPFVKYPSERWPAVETLFSESLREIREIPGVTSAAFGYAPPTRPSWTTGFTIRGRPVPDPGQVPEASYRPVTPGYFDAAGIRLLRGRDFTPDDGPTAPGVVIVNQAFADTHFPDGDALGSVILKESWWEGTPEGEWTIVGIAENVRFGGRDGPTPLPGFYFPHAQRPMTDMWLLIRTQRDIADVTRGVREAIWRHDPTIPLETVYAMSTELEDLVGPRRFSAALMTVFGLVALGLAAGGLFGVLSYTVSRRTHEMGVRMSLGAAASDVRRLVLRQALRLTIGGLVLGLMGAVATGRFVASLLFGVGGMDPPTLTAVALLLVAVSLLASFVPARRATRVDPAKALRVE
ncbi:MAG: ABC transporter permease [Gemmatimonadota bacterium]